MESAAAIREGANVSDSRRLDFLPGLHALVLAAGSGARFGGDKLRASWEGGTLIQAAVAAAKRAPVAGVTVLIRPGDRLVDDPSVRLLEVPDHAEGVGATLRAGVAALPEGCRGVFVFLGDMPRIPLEVAPRLAAALDAGAAAAAPEYQGRLGHPVLFSAALFPELLALRGDRGARAVLERLGERLERVAVDDDGVVFDVDSPAQLAAAVQHGSGVAARSGG